MLKKTLLGIAAATVITVSAMAGTTTQASAGGFQVYLTHGYGDYCDYYNCYDWRARGHWGGRHHSRGHRGGHSRRHNRGHRRGNRRGNRRGRR
jgi:hypothetical protein